MSAMDAEAQQTIDPRHYRTVIGGFATGVAVVTTRTPDGPAGMTVNSLTSVSLEPTLLLVCLTRDSRTARAVREAGEFVVNLLDHTQRHIASAFARPGQDHFRDVDIEPHSHDLPVLGGGLGHLSCKVERIDDGGDHVIVLGRVVDCVVHTGEPLVLYRGRYGRHIGVEQNHGSAVGDQRSDLSAFPVDPGIVR